MLYMLLAVGSLLLTVFSVYMYVSGGGNVMYLVGIIVFLIATVGLGGLYLSGRVNQKEEIHITE